ncbi:MAG: aspartate/glutamate racemase family protein [Sphaerochaetaceae bacterium]|nr:aspartate/glutamate racemase family protein [Sphaerochaetaceae bacterium]
MKANSVSESIQRKTIIIGGGVGPAAGVDLHRQIISLTPTDGSDQDHLRVIHLSFSDLIPDRTEALKGGYGAVAAQRMAEMVNQAYYLSHKFNSEAVVGIPCNTFHADPIFSVFRESILPELELINMIDETLLSITKKFPGGEKVGILSTSGTRSMGIYTQKLEHSGFTALQVEDQESITQAIYNSHWGIKAKSGPSDQNRKILDEAVTELREKGAQTIILGCTEVPLVLTGTEYQGITLIDPMHLLAKALVHSALPQ